MQIFSRNPGAHVYLLHLPAGAHECSRHNNEYWNLFAALQHDIDSYNRHIAMKAIHSRFDFILSLVGPQQTVVHLNNGSSRPDRRRELPLFHCTKACKSY